MKMKTLFCIILTGVLLMSGCSNTEKILTDSDTVSEESKPKEEDTSESTTNLTENTTTEEDPILMKITAEEAKKMIDGSEEIILLDVRTPEEYEEGHIEDAILIPDYEIADQAVDTLKDKTATILIYCRSGRRSALAAQELSNLGYTAIYDFGGIIDWPYDIVE